MNPSEFQPYRRLAFAVLNSALRDRRMPIKAVTGTRATRKETRRHNLAVIRAWWLFEPCRQAQPPRDPQPVLRFWCAVAGEDAGRLMHDAATDALPRTLPRRRVKTAKPALATPASLLTEGTV